MKEAKKSAFNFSKPQIDKIEFCQNGEFDSSKYSGMPISYNAEVNQISENEAITIMDLQIGGPENQFPFNLSVTIRTGINWDDGQPESVVEKVIKENSCFLLLSYIRPFVAHLTSDAGLPTFTIPFLDVRDDQTKHA